MKKEKLSMQQFMLIVNGPSCGGKSAVISILLEQYGGILNAKSDQIKWLISDYQSEIYSKTVNEMIFEMIKVALRNNLSVVKEGALFEPEKLFQIAKDFKTPLFIANVSAPKEVLEKRFLERVEAKKNGAKISNVDPVRFEKLYQTYLATKMDSLLEFDSSLQSPEEIASVISEHIKSKL